MALPCGSPFFEGARLDRGLTLTLCGRHPGARIYPRSSDARILAIDHPSVFDFCDHSRYLDALQFRPKCQVAGKVLGHAEVPSLAPYFAKRGHRQKLCDSLSMDR